jgi:hypothetical protein
MSREQNATIALAIAFDAIAPNLSLSEFSEEEKEQIFKAGRLLTAKIEVGYYSEKPNDETLYKAIDTYIES